MARLSLGQSTAALGARLKSRPRVTVPSWLMSVSRNPRPAISRTEGSTSKTKAQALSALWRSSTKHHQRCPPELHTRKYSGGGTSKNGMAKTVSLGNQCSRSSARYTTSMPKHLADGGVAVVLNGDKLSSHAKLAGSWTRKKWCAGAQTCTAGGAITAPLPGSG